MPVSVRLTAVACVLAGAVAACAPPPQAPPVASDAAAERKAALIARAASLELPTPYTPPPGDALSHHASGFAKTMCSAVFITGLDLAFAAEHVGYFAAPYAMRAKLGAPVLDREKRTVSVTVPGGPTRVAVYTGPESQGCITLAEGSDRLSFTPERIERRISVPATAPWPMGDTLPADPLPSTLRADRLAEAVAAAFANPEGHTAAFVVTHKGRLIAERYGAGITATTPLESWSMGKSVTGTVMATLIRRGVYDLWQPAPVPEWQQTPGDPRAAIRIGDIMRMSSGLRIKAPNDPDYDPNGTYPDHLYLYTGAANTFAFAATRPLQWPPNTVGRYRNTDPVVTNYLNRLGAETLGEHYLSYPQRAIFDKLGIRTMVMETDPYGNYLTQGYEFMSARDWARLGNLYLQDGVWNGERLLPEGYVAYASTLAPAWVADQRPQYGGGFFWINGDGGMPVPKEAYYMSGAGGQTTLIIPSHDLVVVRLGHFKGARPGGDDFDRALALLMEAVPAR